MNTASREGSGDSSLFSSALGFLKSNKVGIALHVCYSPTSVNIQDEHVRPVDEEDVQRAHRKAYDEDSPSSLSAGSLGSAAAMQVHTDVSTLALDPA